MRVGLRLADDVVGSQAEITDRAGQGVGHVRYSVNHRVLQVEWIEVNAEHRRWGLGMDAVRLLEAQAVERWGVREARARVPVGAGLALYFWLRLGYRPAGVEAGDVPDNDAMVMVRELKERAA
jgi:GNAT superfamily N-acetyltransferase